MTAQTLAEKEAEFLNHCVSAAHEINASDIEDLRSAIAKAAYFRAEKRGFQPGYDMLDWLEAEREVRSQRTDVRHRLAANA